MQVLYRVVKDQEITVAGPCLKDAQLTVSYSAGTALGTACGSMWARSAKPPKYAPKHRFEYCRDYVSFITRT